MQLRHSFSRRDVVLVLVGASFMHVFTTLFAYPGSSSIVINTHLPSWKDSPASTTTVTSTQTTTTTTISPVNEPSQIATPINLDLGLTHDLPETSIIAHAPGWTLFRNLYMSNGTLFLLSSDPSSSQFPEIRLMTSTGLPAVNTPENIALREPTKQEMDFISPEEARRRWGGHVDHGDRNRVWTVEGNTLLFNEPAQFLDHYYHFVAELFLGVWAFWFGAFSQKYNHDLPSPSSPFSLSSALHQPSFNQHLLQPTSAPPITRAIFIHASADGWRDGPGFNAYFLHAVFPSLSVEVSADWADRIAVTAPHPGSANAAGKAWHFPLVMLADRSAANRGEACGSRTQRIAAEPWELMVKGRGIDLVGGWWSGIREAIWRFAGAERGINKEGEEDAHAVGGGWNWLEEVDAEGAEVYGSHVGQGADDVPVRDPQLDLPFPEKVVITYINRQGVRRHLIEENHDGMVAALEELVERKNVVDGKEWELNVVQAEKLSKDEQVRVVANSTILLGVHGNGLTHMVLMKPTRVSAVIELFYPGGFARDYEWTTRALGMRHFSVWNDTYFTHPNEPELGYPEGFQGTSIPVHGPAVAKLVEDRVEGRV